ncbi:alkaline phosphatase family protein [Streptosporangium sp. NPDC049376]|uniref:alkaline phosphatase family protein n=1 Tax=Streptosporangium sp. NPDC049376 TaxID=3366192 RepID=UPI0037A9DDE9
MTATVVRFRAELSALLRSEQTGSSPRDVVVLAVDGMSHAYASHCWPTARTRRHRSVFPTTSSAGWLSSMTGLEVADHGVPGVVFADPEHCDRLVNVFTHTGADLIRPTATIFTDARTIGYRPVAVLGDLQAYPSTWRDRLLTGADPVDGPRFFSEGADVMDERELVRRLDEAVRAARDAGSPGAPTLVWCYLELDRHLHRHGYDRYAVEVMVELGRYAERLAENGTVVVAHSDHGLTPTRHDPELDGLLRHLCRTHGAMLAGAGRTRWFHASPAASDVLYEVLLRELPTDVRVARRSELFAESPLITARVGDVVILAEGERFITDPGYRWEHGSRTEAELDTPFSLWGA